MSTYTRKRLGPQGWENTAGQKTQGNVNTQAQHGGVPGRRAYGVDAPFPNKPVSHRRPPDTRKQDSLGLCDFEKITITEQPRDSFLPPEHHSNGTRDITRSQHPRKASHGQPSGELQMARLIHAKKLILQKNLWKVEEKIRQKIQRDSVEDAAGYDEIKSEEERHSRGQAERRKAQTKTRLSEQNRREAVRGREMFMQERRQEDVRQLRRKQDQRNEDRMRITHEEEGGRWKIRDREIAECPQSTRKGNKGDHNVTVNKQKVSGELKKSRWENVKEYTRGTVDERNCQIRGEAVVRPRDGIEKAKEIEQNETSIGKRGWTRENKYWERTCKDLHCSYDKQDMPQLSKQKSGPRLPMENQRDMEQKICGESSLPPVSSSSISRTEHKEELGLMDSPDTSIELLPCRVCNRKFASERLEKHLKICKKVTQSHRQVFNSYVNRTKGSAIEEFWKTHSRSKTPEVLQKKNKRQNHKVKTRNEQQVQQGRLQAGTS